MDNLDYYRVEKAIKYLEDNFKDQPSLEDLAKELNLSPFYFQKMFKRWAGISPKKFIQFLTVEYTKDVLKNFGSTTATFDSGLSSTSRLHDLYINFEAVTPKEFKTLGNGLKIDYGFHQSPFGLALIGITDKGICSLQFIDNDKRNEAIDNLRNEWSKAELIEDTKRTKEYFNKIFKNRRGRINIFVKGTNFQIQVWKALLNIPEGKLVTYKDIAEIVGIPGASRAVGSAVGSNPVSFLIPCHRVINKIGIIGNYRWGKLRKKAMIGWEASKQSST